MDRFPLPWRSIVHCTLIPDKRKATDMSKTQNAAPGHNAAPGQHGFSGWHSGGDYQGYGHADTSRQFTGNPFPTDLAEKQAIGAADKAALGEISSNMAVRDHMQVTGAITHDGAAFDNSLGAFTVTADGTIQAVKMLDPAIDSGFNTDPNTSFTYDTTHGANELAYFLVADGAQLNNNYSGLDFSKGTLNFVYDYGQADVRAAKVTDDGGKVSLVFHDGGGDHVLEGKVFFSTDRDGANSLNADGMVHTVSGVDGTDSKTLTIAFEDYSHNASDRDYNDAVIKIQIRQDAPQVCDNNPPPCHDGGDLYGHCAYDLSFCDIERDHRQNACEPARAPACGIDARNVLDCGDAVTAAIGHFVQATSHGAAEGADAASANMPGAQAGVHVGAQAGAHAGVDVAALAHAFVTDEGAVISHHG
jgi:hypothetical protein